MNPLEQRDGYVLLSVRVQPKASRDAICGESDGRVRVALTAPPVDGAANKALVRFLAKELGLPRRVFSVVRGERSREKTLRLDGVCVEEVVGRLMVG